MCSVYHEGSNARYFFSFIAKVTTAERHHQGLFEEKEKEKGLTKVLEFLGMVKILKKRLE